MNRGWRRGRAPKPAETTGQTERWFLLITGAITGSIGLTLWWLGESATSEARRDDYLISAVAVLAIAMLCGVGRRTREWLAVGISATVFGGMFYVAPALLFSDAPGWIPWCTGAVGALFGTASMGVTVLASRPPPQGVQAKSPWE